MLAPRLSYFNGAWEGESGRLEVQVGIGRRTLACCQSLFPAMPSDLGPDGCVRLRAYLFLANNHWFSGHCRGCGRVSRLG